MTSLTPRLRRAAAVVGVLPLLVLAGGQGVSFATPPDSPESATATAQMERGGDNNNAGGGNIDCPDGLEELKLEEGQLANGTYGDGVLSVDLSAVDVEGGTFTWSSDLVVDTLIVKGGSVDAEVTKVNATSGTGETPENRNSEENFGLSNIKFCYEKPAAASPSPSPDADAETSPSPNPASSVGAGGDADTSPSPSPSPDAAETTSPSPSPSPEVTETTSPSPSPASGVGNQGGDQGGNEPCPDGTVELKIDSDELRDGTFTSEDGQLIVEVEFNGLEDFDFTSNIPVTTVIVKGGPQANVYTFTGPVMSGNDLNAGLNPNSKKNYEISNIKLCYVPQETAPASPSPSPTTGTENQGGSDSSPTPSATPTASISPSPDADDTETSSPSPTPASGVGNQGGNQPCPDGTLTLKIDSGQLQDGVFTSEDGQLVVTVDFNGLRDVDFTSNLPVTTVIVKGGPQANVYTFTGPVMSGNDLNAGLNEASGKNFDISNVKFCYVPQETAPASPSPSPAVTSTSSPTPAPVETSTTSPSPSPSPAATSTTSPSPAATGTTSPSPAPATSPIGGVDDSPATGGQNPAPAPVTPPVVVVPAPGVQNPAPAPAPVLPPVVGIPVDQPATGGGEVVVPAPAPLPVPIEGVPADQPAQLPEAVAGGDAQPAQQDEQQDDVAIGGAEESAATGAPSLLPFTGLPTLGVLSAALTLLLVGGAVTYAARRREDALYGS